MAFNRQKNRQLRLEEIERELPIRVRKEPKPGDNPLKRPYPPHAHDIEEVDALLERVQREIPTEFCKRDLRTVTRPHGVLYFHVLDIQDVKLSDKDFVAGAPFCIYVEYECQGVIKCSYPVNTHRTPKIRIDHYAHFSADLSEVRSDEANDFVVHVYAFQNPEKHSLIGSQLLHLYNFVREIHGITTVQIQDDLNYYVGRVSFEFAWAYGSFGYGHSNQLRNTKNPVFDSVCHSMFPRIGTHPEDLIDNKFRVRVPDRLRLVNLHSLLVRIASKGDAKPGLGLAKSFHKEEDLDKEAKTVIFRRAKYSRGRPVHVALNLDIHQKFMESDFNQSYGEYVCLRNRRERLEHLTRMVEGRLKDRFESEATNLFHPENNIDNCRKNLSIKKPLACPPGYEEHYLHPKPNPPRQPVKLTEKEEQFISSLTSAPRFSGYLATVFGYAKKPKKPIPVEECEFVIPPNAFLGGGERETDGMTLCRRIQYLWRRFWRKTRIAIMTFLEYIFPSHASRAEVQLPEISVTLPSPADSTTEFYAHCIQDKIYQQVPELQETKRLATTLIRTARRKRKDDNDVDADYDEETQWETEPEIEEPEYEKLPIKLADSRKKVRDIRVLEHVEKAKFGHQRTSLVKKQNNFLDY